jgi:gas vesicle protein
MSEDRNVPGGNLLLAFLAGAAAGAVVALLTSPKNGREMRESLASWVRRSGAGDAVTRAVRAAREAIDGTREDEEPGP